MLKINGKNVVKGRFPNNELDYISNLDYITNGGLLPVSNDRNWHFELIYESNEDLFNLLMLKKAVDDIIPIGEDSGHCGLTIKFFPYEQMDRAMPDHLFSLKYVAQLINDCNFEFVRVYDPHSNVLPALLKRVDCHYPVRNFAQLNDYDLLFYPDNGAAKKYSEILIDRPYRFGNKKRNLTTGEIIKYEVIADEEDIKDNNILIVDDLVMGGRTFVEAAKALKEMGAARVDLYVTHLMPQARAFYRRIEAGESVIDRIYSADTLDLIPTFNTPEPRP